MRLIRNVEGEDIDNKDNSIIAYLFKFDLLKKQMYYKHKWKVINSFQVNESYVIFEHRYDKRKYKVRHNLKCQKDIDELDKLSRYYISAPKE